ncbi:PhzF family phenazine biosynthesis protein [Salinirubellus salinus]|uniref:PhzF family phenazine biosynthesis protein n=1 Tax=Salinirubellus salinus TaxID=1364945 RepID=A0A9E7R354_9EURY|nr:PhzF family phenazine biosynthesis protein [Salinirubellus salinus]UWM54920.1 PhzF family phenazine biosynthesis protein [Salinirubellus salinus]
MDQRRACLVDAFTTEPLTGNAAGVVPDAAGLNDSQLQAVAAELGASETAFLAPSDDPEADRRVRYFTPTQEVDLCGHATIASHALLAEDGILDPGEHTLETNVGVLDVEVTEDGLVWMTQRPAEVEEIDEMDLAYTTVAEALDVDPAALTDIGADLPLARASTGLPFLVVPVNFLEHLGKMDPDPAKVEALTDEFDATGVYAFTFDTLEAESTLHGRMFAPGAGVPEDPVTGTASGAVAAYLDRFGAIDTDEMQFEQGEFVDRGGRVHVQVPAAPTVDGVRVGGRAVTSLDGSLLVPDHEEEEILEV